MEKNTRWNTDSDLVLKKENNKLKLSRGSSLKNVERPSTPVENGKVSLKDEDPTSRMPTNNTKGENTKELKDQDQKQKAMDSNSKVIKFRSKDGFEKSEKPSLLNRMLQHNGKINLVTGVVTLGCAGALVASGVGLITAIPMFLAGGIQVSKAIDTMMLNKLIQEESKKFDKETDNHLERINEELAKVSGKDMSKPNEITKGDIEIVKNVIKQSKNEIQKDDTTGIKRVSLNFVINMVESSVENIDKAPTIDSKAEKVDSKTREYSKEKTITHGNSESRRIESVIQKIETRQQERKLEAEKVRERMLGDKGSRDNGLQRQ